MAPQTNPGPMQSCPACNSRYESGVVFCPKDGSKLLAAAPAAAQTLVGQVLADRYRIVKKLGEGGMGEVFEAQHVYIDKRFALKLLRPEITTNAEAVARFHQEARSASSIGHDNIVEIDDFGRLPDGSVYLAMELLSGTSLAERMRKGAQLSFDEEISFALQVCCGLGAAHKKGIIHRDMKPENVFLTDKHGMTVAKILDFGIAKVGGEGSQSLTRTGTIFGTPHYMSPEQALGRPLDHRSDIYSVGVIMYEMATGKVPFQAESFMGILSQHITAVPVPPRQLAPERGIPIELEAAIMRAMAKDPAQRYGAAGEMAEALAGVAGVLGPQLGAHSQAFQAIAFEARSSPGVQLASMPGVPIAPGSTPLPRPPSGPYTPARVPTGQIMAPSVAAGSAGSLSMPAVGQATLPTPPRSNAGVWIALAVAAGLALIGGGGAAFYLIGRNVPQPQPTPPVVHVDPPPLVVAPPSPAHPDPPPKEEVLVDTVPTGAHILENGRTIADAPEVLQISRGATMEVTLHRDGYGDRTVTLDPSREHKVIVRLEKIEHHPSKPPHEQAAKQPAKQLPVVVPISSHPATPTKKPNGPINPYE